MDECGKIAAARSLNIIVIFSFILIVSFGLLLGRIAMLFQGLLRLNHLATRVSISYPGGRVSAQEARVMAALSVTMGQVAIAVQSLKSIAIFVDIVAAQGWSIITPVAV